jgi:hypothetical protein
MKVIILGGRNKKDIEKKYNELSLHNILVYEYQESELHIQDYSDLIVKDIFENRYDTLIIKTLWGDILNVIGMCIYKKYLPKENVEYYICDDEYEFKKCTYDDEGYLYNHPIAYYVPQYD